MNTVDWIRFPTTEELEIIVRDAESPSYVLVERVFRENLAIIQRVKRESGAKVLMALKGFACGSLLPIAAEVVDGACASSPHEARLAREELNREVHLFAPAFKREHLEATLPGINHLVFNSVAQKEMWAGFARGRDPAVEFGLRVNPEHSEGRTVLYDPCSPGSRLGIRAGDLKDEDLEGISGLHFHTLCEHDADALERTLMFFEEKFSRWFPGIKWVNFGGGHHLTRPGYDLDLLIRLLRDFRERTGLEVYIEPGEAFGLNVGILVSTVLDLTENDGWNAILDTSATAHMPDVLEMPYRPVILGASEPSEQPHTYRLGGLTCLAGDVIGPYGFPEPLRIGDRLFFGDMGHYTMVKNTTFNGIQLPSIEILRPNGRLEVVRRFGYETFRERLG